MPDFTMCSSVSCQLRAQCYRWLAKPAPRQPKDLFFPRILPGETDWSCTHLIPLHDRRVPPGFFPFDDEVPPA